MNKGELFLVTNVVRHDFFREVETNIATDAVILEISVVAMVEGEEIFVLDMGEPIRIEDLARDLIILSDLEPD